MEIGKGNTATFTAMASGISTSGFMYQWRKRDSNSLPDKVSGVNNSVLTIPNVIESDGGQYYCTVTNEWDRSVMSDEVSLSIFGMLQLFIYVLSYSGGSRISKREVPLQHKRTARPYLHDI